MTSISRRRQAVFRRAVATEGEPRPAESPLGTGHVSEDDAEGSESNPGDEGVHWPVDSGVEKPLFEGDTSTLPYDVRRAYALLLRGPSIDERHSKLWPVLLAHEQRLRQLLHSSFHELVIDYDQKVAFAREVNAPGLEVPQLLRVVRLTFLESALIVYLRTRLTLADAAGERATLARTELVEHLKAYEASDNVDKARFGRQVDGAIEKAKKYNLLRQIRNSDDRFEVSPVLKLVFSHEQITELRRTYQRIAEVAGIQLLVPGGGNGMPPDPQGVVNDEED